MTNHERLSEIIAGESAQVHLDHHIDLAAKGLIDPQTAQHARTEAIEHLVDMGQSVESATEKVDQSIADRREGEANGQA